MAQKTPEIIELDASQLEKLLERAQGEAFDSEDYQTIYTLVESYACLTGMLHDKKTTIARLRKLLFGASTEKTDAVIGGQEKRPPENAAADPPPESAGNPTEDGDQPKKKKKGHGRNGADAYAGGEKIDVPHQSLKVGDDCPLRG